MAGAVVVGLVVAASVVGTGLKHLESDGTCSGAAYEDFRAHLVSRGAEATCDDFKSMVAAGMAATSVATADEPGFSSSSASSPSSRSHQSAELVVVVPDLQGVPGPVVADTLQALGLRADFTDNWGVVSTQRPEPGTPVKPGTSMSFTWVSGNFPR